MRLFWTTARIGTRAANSRALSQILDGCEFDQGKKTAASVVASGDALTLLILLNNHSTSYARSVEIRVEADCLLAILFGGMSAHARCCLTSVLKPNGPTFALRQREAECGCGDQTCCGSQQAGIHECQQRERNEAARSYCWIKPIAPALPRSS